MCRNRVFKIQSEGILRLKKFTVNYFLVTETKYLIPATYGSLSCSKIQSIVGRLPGGNAIVEEDGREKLLNSWKPEGEKRKEPWTQIYPHRSDSQ